LGVFISKTLPYKTRRSFIQIKDTSFLTKQRGKKEEGERGEGVYVSLGFLIGGYRRIQSIPSFGGFYKK